MIDLKSRIVLKILSKECPNGAYKIVDGSDIISAMPNKYKINNETLQHIMIYLERQDCISIKYDDDNTYCVAVLPYGYEICEDNAQKDKKEKRISPLLLVFLLFFVAFAASLCASVLTKFVF